MMRDGTGQRQSQVRRQRAKTGGRELHQVASSETGPMNLRIRHQAQQTAIQQCLSPPRDPAGITSDDIAEYNSRQERMTTSLISDGRTSGSCFNAVVNRESRQSRMCGWAIRELHSLKRTMGVT